MRQTTHIGASLLTAYLKFRDSAICTLPNLKYIHIRGLVTWFSSEQRENKIDEFGVNNFMNCEDEGRVSIRQYEFPLLLILDITVTRLIGNLNFFHQRNKI